MGAAVKPKLCTQEQIDHLTIKGVKFIIANKEDAIRYLSRNNNYFKLTAYRKVFPKHEQGENIGKYQDLDFAQLRDLSIIDMRLRYQMLEMALDVEHYAKVRLLKYIEDRADENGYSIVEDYRTAIGADNCRRLDADFIERAKSPYCGSIIEKYSKGFPVWAFVEIISFGGLVSFYQYCSKRYSDKELEDIAYLMLNIKDLRNAAAHNNCILNDLDSGSNREPKYRIMEELAYIGVSKRVRKVKMANIRLQQIVTLLYTHKTIVTSDGIHQVQCRKLHEVLDRMYHHIEYYRTNSIITSAFDFLKMVIDNWFAVSI